MGSKDNGLQDLAEQLVQARLFASTQSPALEKEENPVQGEKRYQHNQGREWCGEHTRHRLDYWCLEDETAVCQHCLIFGSHRGHNVQKDPSEEKAFSSEESFKDRESSGEEMSRLLLATQAELRQLPRLDLEVAMLTSVTVAMAGRPDSFPLQLADPTFSRRLSEQLGRVLIPGVLGQTPGGPGHSPI